MSDIQSEKICCCWNQIGASGAELRGLVMTPDGWVYVSTWTFRDKPVAHFQMGLRGRAYRRRVEGDFSRRYLVTLARRFAAEVAEMAEGATE